MAEFITFRVIHNLQKTWKNYTKICKFCNIIVETRWDKFRLNLKHIYILSQCCYLSKGNSFEPLIGRVISFRVLHDLQKTWKNCIKICKFWYIIVEARWYKFCLNLKHIYILSQCCYLSKGNSFKPLMAELYFWSTTQFSKERKFHKNM